MNSLSLQMQAAQAGLNRNILECKCLSPQAIAKALHVLIETYWNVNTSDDRNTSEAGAGLNRNILECK